MNSAVVTRLRGAGAGAMGKWCYSADGRGKPSYFDSTDYIYVPSRHGQGVHQGQGGLVGRGLGYGYGKGVHKSAWIEL